MTSVVTLPQLLQRSAALWPDRVAVACRAATMTYGALEQFSQRLAGVLRRHGVTSADRVGVWLPKSVTTVAALAGVLQAGAAYVPFDPTAPPQRVALMAADCQLAALITTSAKLATLPAGCVPPCVILTEGHAPNAVTWDEVQAAEPVTPAWETGRTAYILYTSGSTGQPKGVVISQRAAWAFVGWATDYFRLGPADRLANHAPLHFDLSTFDIFAAWASGAATVLVPPETALFPRALADWIAQQAISVWYSVPSALTQLVLRGALERHNYPKLRTILFAGEVFPVNYLRQLKALIPQAAYYNLYGPTETNVCTVFALPPEIALTQTAPFPIGQECAGDEIFLTEENELCVAGPSVMEGYWNRPELTAAAFTEIAGRRAYRTGDLVRRDAEGHYHFVGRRDAMVKSRGYRIELGEVEAALYRHPNVAQAAVVAVPDDEIGARLRAYIALREGSTLTARELAVFCAAQLPSYMIPAEFVWRDSLPHTATGKIDRQQL